MANIKDVAKALGISVTTVSRALNGYSDVNEDTRSNIVRVARELNYTPNRTAQKLVKKASNTLAIIVSEIGTEGSYNTQCILSGAYTFAESIGYEVALFVTNATRQKEKTYYQFCREHDIEGAVVCGISTGDKYFEELIKSEISCVLIDMPAEGGRVSSITIDNVSAAEEAVGYLISNNHRNIAVMNGSKGAYVTHKRFTGYLNAMKKSGIPIKEEYIMYGNYSEETALNIAKKALQKNPEITAFFCSSDLMAIGVMRAARELGLKLPEDLSIVGFDDIPPSRYVTPSLTTIAQDMFLFGQEAGRLLYKLIKGEECKRQECLPYKLVIRDSVVRL